MASYTSTHVNNRQLRLILAVEILIMTLSKANEEEWRQDKKVNAFRYYIIIWIEILLAHEILICPKLFFTPLQIIHMPSVW